MATQQKLAGNWNQLKGLLRERWGQLSDDELQEVQGNFEQLVGLIQGKTGQAKSKIENIVQELSEQSAGFLGQAKEMARGYLGDAGESVDATAAEIRDRMTARYSDAQHMVQRRPAESVAVAFGTGLIAGVIVGLVLRTR